MENEFYLLSGRGLGGSGLFLEESDYDRFLFLILHFQSPTQIYNITYCVSAFTKKQRFGVGESKLNKILKNRQLQLLSFALMPGHYHLLIRNVERHSVSAYMQRVLMAYGKYFNSKYKKIGHVFDGPYRSVHLTGSKDLLEASSHIHKNPMELAETNFAYEDYPYSSCQDYISQNRWGDLLKTEIILKHFKDAQGYMNYLQSEPNKDTDLMLEF
jgi:putative transposase